ncbi:MAG: ATP-binding cassette domain-containing protein [Lentisphaerae bacterium]|nr:ATP-binding cassette domain-containing protein [Lentisphaerota bacterium]
MLALDGENVLQVSDLTIGYGEKIVLENLNFSVRRGEIFAIMGGSGCGKSTLLKHLTGILPVMSGTVKLFEHDFSRGELPGGESIAGLLGVTYQGGALLGSLTLAENVALVLEENTRWSRRKIMTTVQEKLAQVDLAEFADYYPAEISGGMKKRAGLARALAMDPPLLFFDEPSAGLDPISSAELDRLILRLRNDFGRTIVIVTHELESVFAIADRVIMLDKASRTIIAEGDPRVLRSQSDDPWVREFLNRSNLVFGAQASAER